MNTRLLSQILIILLISTRCYADVQTDGADDYIEVLASNVSALQPTPELTACMWSRRDGANENAGNLFGISYDDTDSGPYYAWAIVTSSTSDTNFIAFSGTNPGLVQNSSTPAYSVFPNTTDWHYVCFRSSIATFITIDMIVDGVNRSTITTVAGVNIAYNTTTGKGDLYIGCDAEDADNCTAHTNADFTYWNTDLTDAEILSIYNARKRRFALQVRPSNIILHLPLDEFPDGKAVSGSTFSSNTNTNNGTAGGGASIVSKAGSLSYP